MNDLIDENGGSINYWYFILFLICIIILFNNIIPLEVRSTLKIDIFPFKNFTIYRKKQVNPRKSHKIKEMNTQRFNGIKYDEKYVNYINNFIYF
jgi:hypothetical protein